MGSLVASKRRIRTWCASCHVGACRRLSGTFISAVHGFPTIYMVTCIRGHWWSWSMLPGNRLCV
jgi:hypothetical protein